MNTYEFAEMFQSDYLMSYFKFMSTMITYRQFFFTSGTISLSIINSIFFFIDHLDSSLNTFDFKKDSLELRFQYLLDLRCLDHGLFTIRQGKEVKDLTVASIPSYFTSI